MSTSKRVQRWADKHGKKPIQVYLDRDCIETLDLLKEARTVTDKITGKERKQSYADVIMAAVRRESWSDWAGLVDSANESAEFWTDNSKQYQDWYEDTLSDLTSARSEIATMEAEALVLKGEIERVKKHNNVDAYKRQAARDAQHLLKQNETIKKLREQLNGEAPC